MIFANYFMYFSSHYHSLIYWIFLDNAISNPNTILWLEKWPGLLLVYLKKQRLKIKTAFSTADSNKFAIFDSDEYNVSLNRNSLNELIVISHCKNSNLGNWDLIFSKFTTNSFWRHLTHIHSTKHVSSKNKNFFDHFRFACLYKVG